MRLLGKNRQLTTLMKQITKNTPNKKTLTKYNKVMGKRMNEFPEKLKEKEFDLDEWLIRMDLWTGKKVAPLKNKIAKDYKCQSVLEILLAGRIATLYWRINHWESSLAFLLAEDIDSYSRNETQIKAVKEFSKGIESAHNQLITSIALLKELKQPPLNLQIKTQGAFITQNQQVNLGKQKRKTKNKKIVEGQ